MQQRGGCSTGPAGAGGSAGFTLLSLCTVGSSALPKCVTAYANSSLCVPPRSMLARRKLSVSAPATTARSRTLLLGAAGPSEAAAVAKLEPPGRLPNRACTVCTVCSRRERERERRVVHETGQRRPRTALSRHAAAWTMDQKEPNRTSRTNRRVNEIGGMFGCSQSDSSFMFY